MLISLCVRLMVPTLERARCFALCDPDQEDLENRDEEEIRLQLYFNDYHSFNFLLC